MIYLPMLPSFYPRKVVSENFYWITWDILDNNENLINYLRWACNQ